MKQTNYFRFSSTTGRSKVIALLLFIFSATGLYAQCDGTTIAFKWGGGTVYTYAYSGVLNGKCSYKQMSPGTSICWSGSQWNIYGNNAFLGTVFWHSTKDVGDRPSGDLNDWVSDMGLIMISLTGTGVITTLTVTTEAVTEITPTTAIGNGNISLLGPENVTAYGVCWNTTGSPTIADSIVDKGATSATGAFTAEMTRLTENTLYYVRAYATNSLGTTYGSEVTFSSLITSLSSTIRSDFNVISPAGGKIAVSGINEAEVMVFNQLGQKVFASEAKNGLLNRSFTKGLYVVSVIANGKTVNKKVVVR